MPLVDIEILVRKYRSHLLSVALSSVPVRKYRSQPSVGLVDIEVPVRKCRSQPSVGCPYLTLKSLLESIVFNLLSVALVDIEVSVRKYRSQPSVGCP